MHKFLCVLTGNAQDKKYHSPPHFSYKEDIGYNFFIEKVLTT